MPADIISVAVFRDALGPRILHASLCQDQNEGSMQGATGIHKGTLGTHLSDEEVKWGSHL